MNLLNLGGHSLRWIMLEFIWNLGIDFPLHLTVILYNNYMSTN